MTQEQLRMQMLAGIITEGQYKAKLNENTLDFSDNNRAFGILYRKPTPEESWVNSKYVWINQNVEDYMEYLGYGADSYDVATEVMDFSTPGTEDDAASIGMLGNPNYDPETTTLGQYREVIEDEFEKPV